MHQARLRVLLANEQEAWHQTVRGLLEPQGVCTLSARSGREVLDVLKQGDIHVAVLDAQMPQLGGLQVLRMIQQHGKAPPAILLADQPTNQLMQEALSFNVFSVLGKPVNYPALLDSLARVVRRHYEGRWPL